MKTEQEMRKEIRQGDIVVEATLWNGVIDFAPPKGVTVFLKEYDKYQDEELDQDGEGNACRIRIWEGV